jgi:hypothetical protein
VSYRVKNARTGEVRGEFGLHQFEIAQQYADALAADSGYRERYVVEQTVTVYETPMDQPSRK